MSRIKFNWSYWIQIFLLPVYWLSFLMPRDKNIWVFGSTFGKRFADGPRYFYLYMSQFQKKKVRPIWISRNKEIVGFLTSKGYEAYYAGSVKGIWYSLRGKVYLYDNYSKDINFWLSGNALKVNLWHGIPLKKIQADNLFDRCRNPLTVWDRWKYALRRISDEKPSHYVLTTSDFLIPIFSSAFRTKRVLTSGYPRNDVLISKKIKNIRTPIEEKYYSLITNRSYRKMALYMPTFRDSEKQFFQKIDLKEFKQFLEEQEILLCVKLHPKSKLKEEFKKIEGTNMLVIDADTDPYVFLGISDMLITDYSSIYFDYLLLDKPIIFFNYDLEEYLKNSRELYFDYEEFTPGIKAADEKQLKEVLSNIDKLYCGSEIQEKRKQIRDKVFNDITGLASERLYHDIQKILS